MARREDLLPHLGLPVPDLKDLPKPSTKDDRLKTIVSNFDKQTRAVRLSIIETAKQKQDQALALAEDDPDDRHARGISPADSAQPVDWGKKPFVASLNAPWHESLGDPCIPAEGAGPPSLPPGVRKMTPPPAVQLVKDAFDLIEMYDRQAKPVRKEYVDELGRCDGRRSSGAGSGTKPGVVEARPGAPTRPSGMGNASPGVFRAPFPNAASPTDPSRDPRRNRKPW
jgi:hypothetical protein